MKPIEYYNKNSVVLCAFSVFSVVKKNSKRLHSNINASSLKMLQKTAETSEQQPLSPLNLLPNITPSLIIQSAYCATQQNIL
ncbi:MAG: hypothetical protein GY795_01655 [Desulfobacterales bacterium]|nr:hypothetical protein [Desulfobacterales bacterium]